MYSFKASSREASSLGWSRVWGHFFLFTPKNLPDLFLFFFFFRMLIFFFGLVQNFFRYVFFLIFKWEWYHLSFKLNFQPTKCLPEKTWQKYKPTKRQPKTVEFSQISYWSNSSWPEINPNQRSRTHRFFFGARKKWNGGKTNGVGSTLKTLVWYVLEFWEQNISMKSWMCLKMSH